VLIDDMPVYALSMYLSVVILAFILTVLFVHFGMKFDCIQNIFIFHSKDE